MEAIRCPNPKCRRRMAAEIASATAQGKEIIFKEAEGGNKTTEKDKGKTQKVEKQDAEKVQQESPATLEGIRALMAQKTQEGKSKEIKELLQKYGAAKLSAVKPEYMSDFRRIAWYSPSLLTMPFMTPFMRVFMSWYNAESFSNPIPPSVVS